MNIKNVLTITKKELKGYFDGPVAYVVLVVFLVLWEYFFFRTAFLVSDATVRIMLDTLPWLMLILVPAITMGLIAGERSEGTLELLLTHPISTIELVLGKFLAAAIFIALAMAAMLPVIISFSFYGKVDWGVFAGQYGASVMLGTVLIALGIMVSSWFASQIAALLVTAALGLILLIVGSQIVTFSLPGPIVSVVERLSVMSHFESMARGVIDTRDLVYFISAVVVFLSLAWLQVIKIKFGNRLQIFHRYLLGVSLIVGIMVGLNVLGGRIPGRIDLTSDKIYTLSPATKNTIGNLDDVVNIKFYVSAEVPVQLQSVVRDTKDILRDYKALSNGKVKTEVIDPSGNQQVETEAQNMGVRPIQFNVVGEEELQLKQGYMGLAIMYGGDFEVIPIISSTADLEYQLTGSIRKLTIEDKTKVAFLSGHGEKSINTDYSILSQELEKQFQIETINFETDSEAVPEDIGTLIVAGPNLEVTPAERKALVDYLNRGGAMLLLIDAVEVSPQTLVARENVNSLADLLGRYGLEIVPDIVYDIRSHETVSFGGGQGTNFIVPYPFWPRVLATEKTSPIVGKIDMMVLPWPSRIKINEEIINSEGWDLQRLFKTTSFAGRQVGSFSLAPDQSLDVGVLQEELMAVSLTAKANDQGTISRLVVVGDSDFLTDDFAANQPSNLAFGIEAVSWLSQEESLAGIQLKQRISRKMIFSDTTQRSVVKFVNLGLVTVVPAGVGLLRLSRRRRLREIDYPGK